MRPRECPRLEASSPHRGRPVGSPNSTARFAAAAPVGSCHCSVSAWRIAITAGSSLTVSAIHPPQDWPAMTGRPHQSSANATSGETLRFGGRFRALVRSATLPPPQRFVTQRSAMSAPAKIPFDTARLDRLMDEADMDVLIATSKHNVQYLLGGHRAFFFETMDAMGLSLSAGAGLRQGAPDKGAISAIGWRTSSAGSVRSGRRSAVQQFRLDRHHAARGQTSKSGIKTRASAPSAVAGGRRQGAARCVCGRQARRQPVRAGRLRS